MRNAVSSIFAAGLITALVACANGSSDNPSTDVNGTDPDSGVGTKPANNNNGDTDSGGGGNTGTDSGGGNTGTDSGGGNTNTDSGGGNTGTDSGGGNTNTDKCSTSGAVGAAYLSEYFKLSDPTTVPCPCAATECCYDNGVYPAACVKK